MIKEKKRALEAEKDKIAGKIIEGKKIKELTRKKTESEKEFQRLH